MSRDDDEPGRAAYEAEVIGMGIRAVGEARMTQTPHPAQAVITSPVIALGDHVIDAVFARVTGIAPTSNERVYVRAFARAILEAANVQTVTEPAPRPPRAWEGPSRAIPGAGPDLAQHRRVEWTEPPP